MAPVWIEAALNGPWGRAQPLAPLAVDAVVADALACVKAGASIVHLHAYDAATGRQNDDPDTYAAIFEAIRAEVDAIVYPTLPFVQSAQAFAPDALAVRYRAVEALGARGLLEWGVVDPGSTHLQTFDDVAKDGIGSVYLNPGDHVRRGLELAQRFNYVPSYAIYEPGFIRLGAAMATRFACPVPIYRFMFSDQFTFGYPPRPWALDALLALMAECAPGAPWMAAGLGVDILPLFPDILSRGGHVRVGLEDAPLGTSVGNVAWVERAVAAVEKAGGRVASAAEVRAALAQVHEPTGAKG